MTTPVDPELPALRAVRAAVATADTPAEVGAAVLEAVGDMLGWLVGTLWLPNDRGELCAAATWRARVHKSRDFEEKTRRTALLPGKGLPGRVWVAGRVIWTQDIANDPHFPRIGAVRVEGLHGAVGFPAMDGERCVGVLEFFTDQFRSPQPALELVLAQVGREVGAALARVGA